MAEVMSVVMHTSTLPNPDWFTGCRSLARPKVVTLDLAHRSVPYNILCLVELEADILLRARS